MDNKKLIIIIAVVAIAIVAVAGYILAGGMSNAETKQTTTFTSGFMDGAFAGNVSEVNKTDYFMSWKDKEHHIEYNMSTLDNTTALVDIQDVQSIIANGGVSGLVGPETRNYNGNDWKIYFTQGTSTDANSSNANKTVNIMICESQGEKQGYLIYVVLDNSSDVKFRLSPFCDAYTEYVEPLLKSITLKESKDVPHTYEELGLSEADFKQQMEIVHQVKAGNYSALQQEEA